MRRLIHSALAAVFVIAALAEPVVALRTTHACCLKRAAAAEQKVTCHGHQAAPSASLSETHSAHSECPDRCCCLGTASRAARPESSLSSAAAPHFVANVRAFEFQPLSQAELPAHSGRAPPSRLFC